jgi:hypothetical protein
MKFLICSAFLLLGEFGDMGIIVVCSRVAIWPFKGSSQTNLAFLNYLIEIKRVGYLAFFECDRKQFILMPVLEKPEQNL